MDSEEEYFVADIEIEEDLLPVNPDNLRPFDNDPRLPPLQRPAADDRLGLGLPPDARRAREFGRFGLPPNMHVRQGREWCECGNCVEEETWENRYCCQQVEKINNKNKEGPQHTGCVTTHPWFEPAILNPATLQIAYWQYVSQYQEHVVEGAIERRYRYTAYRQFVRWCWGFLGKDRRIPMPSCVMKKIRDVFPDEANNYTGFKYPPLDR
ncbi:P2X purinoceptor 7-like [Antedon mediterranea]|uniref:P2X purinoceptor 7-like n=1 Tax=Antedon mediterranea TaxID=105859 RepID=UPI003AF98FC1